MVKASPGDPGQYCNLQDESKVLRFLISWEVNVELSREAAILGSTASLYNTSVTSGRSSEHAEAECGPGSSACCASRLFLTADSTDRQRADTPLIARTLGDNLLSSKLGCGISRGFYQNSVVSPMHPDACHGSQLGHANLSLYFGVDADFTGALMVRGFIRGSILYVYARRKYLIM